MCHRICSEAIIIWQSRPSIDRGQMSVRVHNWFREALMCLVNACILGSVRYTCGAGSMHYEHRIVLCFTETLDKVVMGNRAMQPFL